MPAGRWRTAGSLGEPTPILARSNTESYEQVFLALSLGAVMMILGGMAELVFGVKAEGESLENIAKPLTVEDSPKVAAAPAAAG